MQANMVIQHYFASPKDDSLHSYSTTTDSYSLTSSSKSYETVETYCCQEGYNDPSTVQSVKGYKCSDNFCVLPRSSSWSFSLAL